MQLGRECDARAVVDLIAYTQSLEYGYVHAVSFSTLCLAYLFTRYDTARQCITPNIVRRRYALEDHKSTFTSDRRRNPSRHRLDSIRIMRPQQLRRLDLGHIQLLHLFVPSQSSALPP